MAYRWLYAVSLMLLLVSACGEEESPRVFIGTGGTGGVTGGTSGAGGVGGMGGVITIPECVTNPLCRACPADALCDDAACGDGYVCINSGCSDLDGAPIRQCVFAGGGACADDGDCPDDRRCADVGEIEGRRCIKRSPGTCSETKDCLLGFECEFGSCVDRRIPCILDEDCPMNHTCFGGELNGDFCLRIQVDCDSDIDCVGRGDFCVDIDGDLETECAGSIELNPSSGACTNDRCTAGAPVCEASGIFSVSECGTHGLCLGPDDCEAGFICAELWPDGRKECVREGGSCSSFDDCDPNEICAASRNGDPPACQVGNVDGGE